VTGKVETVGTGGWMRVHVGKVPGSDNGSVSLPLSADNIVVEVLAPGWCGATEGATGITCGLVRWHSLSVDHEGTHEPAEENDSVGYPLFVRWPWNQWDKDYADLVLPEATAREPRVFRSDGPEPPADVVALKDEAARGRQYLVRLDSDEWAWSWSAYATDSSGHNTWAVQARGAKGDLREVLRPDDPRGEVSS
jgi:hypothetical protein